MIVSAFLVTLVLAVLIFMKGIDDDAIAYMGISLVLFLILTASAFYITVPFIDSTDTITEHRYIEYAFVAVCPSFVFIDLLMMILHFMHGRKMKRGDIPYVPPGLQ